jgi:hypothetical protein
MNEGIRFLARQLSWEMTLGQLRERDEAQRLRNAPVELPAPKVEIRATTAGEMIGGDNFEAA